MADASDAHEELTSPDPQFEPIITLPEVEVKTLEEDEDELVRIRAKLFRFDSEADPPEWKERGTGDVKFLKHREKGHIRVLMRRDKTLKVCANHFVLPNMTLTAKSGNPKVWVWNTPADYTDNEARAEMLAIRFGSVENAQKFKTAFDDAREKMVGVLGESKDGEKDDSKEKAEEKKPTDDRKCAETNGTTEKEEESVTEKLNELTVKDKSETTPAKGGTGDGSEVKSDPSSPTDKSPTNV